MVGWLGRPPCSPHPHFLELTSPFRWECWSLAPLGALGWGLTPALPVPNLSSWGQAKGRCLSGNRQTPTLYFPPDTFYSCEHALQLKIIIIITFTEDLELSALPAGLNLSYSTLEKFLSLSVP